MWTQRDQIQAYQFLRRRVVSALVKADANHPVSPSRRLVLGTMLSAVGLLLVCAVFGIIGILKPATNDDWRKGGQVIVEKETGTRFVIGQDGKLHPMLNYASARLLAGGDGTTTVTVSAKRLAAVTRGAPLGIAGAPDSLPLAARLLTGPWTVCTQRATDLPDTAPGSATVLLGPVAAGTPVASSIAVVAVTPDGQLFAVTSGHRYRIADDQTLSVLGWDTVAPLPAAPGWLSTLPAGRDLALLAVPAAGQAGVSVGGKNTRIGQVLQDQAVGAGKRYYLVLSDGLAVITQTEANLILGSPANAAAYGTRSAAPLSTPAAAIAAAPKVANIVADQDVASGGYPLTVPKPAAVADGSAVCTALTGAAVGRLALYTSVPTPTGQSAVSTGGAADLRIAGQIAVPPAAGALIVTRASSSAPAGTLYLVTDAGVKYPVSGTDAIKALGYGAVTPVPLTPAAVALFPTGPTLTTAAAGAPAAASTGR